VALAMHKSMNEAVELVVEEVQRDEGMRIM
jgi:hypothetical protein